MNVLLVSPDRTVDQICGDDIFTRLLRANPPEGVTYTHFVQGLANDWLSRSRRASAWAASLIMHSRPPAGVPYGWGTNPPRPYRVLGKLLPDRPDEDIQWLRLNADAPRFDLVHAWSYPLHLGPPAKRPPVILHCGTGNTDLLRNYYNLSAEVAGKLARRDTRLLRTLGVLHDLYSTSEAAAVIVPSRYAYDMHLAAGVPEAKLHLIRLGFPDPHTPLRPKPGICRFTLVGHQFARKGGHTLVKAFARLHKRHPEARLTLVSAIDPARLGVPLDGITVHQSLPHDTLYARIYPETDVYVLPSLAEGYGMSVVEAMSFGLPVIASHISALPELVANGESGLLVPPDDPDALFEAMRTLMEDVAQRAQMGQAARTRFLAEHVVAVTNQNLKRVYEASSA